MPTAKRTGRSRKVHIFERQLGSSITRHRGEFPENLALQYPGTMRPHDCASWLKCPSYTAPVEPARSRQGAKRSEICSPATCGVSSTRVGVGDGAVACRSIARRHGDVFFGECRRGRGQRRGGLQLQHYQLRAASSMLPDLSRPQPAVARHLRMAAPVLTSITAAPYTPSPRPPNMAFTPARGGRTGTSVI